jgi:hypothetical protein
VLVGAMLAMNAGGGITQSRGNDAQARAQAVPHLETPQKQFAISQLNGLIASVDFASTLHVVNKPATAHKPALAHKPVHHAPGPLYLALNGTYADCTGQSLLRAGLYRDSCIQGTTYLVAHQWSTGRLFLGLHIGSRISFEGRLYTVYRIHTAAAAHPWPYGNAPLTLQTCWTDSGSIFLIIQAR